MTNFEICQVTNNDKYVTNFWNFKTNERLKPISRQIRDIFVSICRKEGAFCQDLSMTNFHNICQLFVRICHAHHTGHTAIPPAFFVNYLSKFVTQSHSLTHYHPRCTCSEQSVLAPLCLVDMTRTNTHARARPCCYCFPCLHVLSLTRRFRCVFPSSHSRTQVCNGLQICPLTHTGIVLRFRAGFGDDVRERPRGKRISPSSVA